MADESNSGVGVNLATGAVFLALLGTCTYMFSGDDGEAAEDGIAYAAGPYPYGCRTLADLADTETRIEDFRRRRDKNAVGYDEARRMIAEPTATFGNTSCTPLQRGERLVLLDAAKLKPDDWAHHGWLLRRGDGSRLWVHTESKSSRPPR